MQCEQMNSNLCLMAMDVVATPLAFSSAASVVRVARNNLKKILIIYSVQPEAKLPIWDSPG